MNERRRKNIIIGVLCSLLVVMGVGYAALSQVLTINSTATVTGKFDIHFLTENNLTTDLGAAKEGITLRSYETATASDPHYHTTAESKAAAMEAATGVDPNDNKLARFSAILEKPGDYARFTVIVKNYGTIKGKLGTVGVNTSASTELATWLTNNGGGSWSDYFEVTTTANQNTVINPGAEYEFLVTVTFKQTATKLPQGALNSVITLGYSQDDTVPPPPEVLTWYVATRSNEEVVVMAFDQNKVLSHNIDNGVDIIDTTVSTFGQVQLVPYDPDDSDAYDEQLVEVTPQVGDYIWIAPMYGQNFLGAVLRGDTLYCYDGLSNSTLEHSLDATGSLAKYTS